MQVNICKFFLRLKFTLTKNDYFIGFSEFTPWVALSSNYKETNVAKQLEVDPNNPLNSHVAIYSYLANLRQNEAILFGSLEFVNSTAEAPDLFGYARVKKGNPGTLVRLLFCNGLDKCQKNDEDNLLVL
jgi:hypothetical protein